MKKKISVGILGATGAVGQKFVQLLADHPWFEIIALAASERSAGKKYGNTVQWISETPISHQIAKLTILPCTPNFACDLVFSGLDAAVAGEIEEAFAQAGIPVISNSKNHRFDPDVPLLVPEINANHLRAIEKQQFRKGFIVTNPNCSTIGLVMALQPLHLNWGLEQVQVVTLQALSGAGYPGVASLDVLDNVIPYIEGEEEKIQSESLKIMGTYRGGAFQNADFQISAQSNRVAVIDGHLECVSVKLKKQPTTSQIIEAWQSFAAEPQQEQLPTAPKQPLHYFSDPRHPQPRLHRNLENGMAVSIGRLRECPVLDFKFIVLSHNTIRGAAGCAILNAELLIQKGYLKLTPKSDGFLEL